METIKTNLIDLFQQKIYPVEISFDSHIRGINPLTESVKGHALPGFVDAHVHIESSMLPPAEFARLAVVHGTVATVSDPHEIANVLGVEGVNYMIANGNQVDFKFNFGAPSCVPATSFETAGATIDSVDIRSLLKRPEIKYLAEMMNWPGVLFKDPEVMNKIAISKELGKPIDGHAPGLMGEDALNYIAEGISTDHECFTYEEGLHKLKNGMKILIREGSAAKNFEALIDLFKVDASKIMFCSDDKHPDDLIQGHLDELVRRALTKGHDLYDVLRAACVNPVEHYNLDVGLLRVGDPADFIVIDEPTKNLNVQATYINGKQVAAQGESRIERRTATPANYFDTRKKSPEDFQLHISGNQAKVILVEDGQLITQTKEVATSSLRKGNQYDLEQDLLKLTVVNRYSDEDPAVAYVKNFELQGGAIASSVAHDSHNIIAVGTNDQDLCEAVNLIIENKGGVAIAHNEHKDVLPLEIAGLMSTMDGYKVAAQYTELTNYAKSTLGCQLHSPFMTLSFLALLVIPQLKLSDKGLFDGQQFKFVELFN